ncbi:MAG: hypothetical protein AAF957_22305 [Planctomycetota bacterium]
MRVPSLASATLLAGALTGVAAAQGANDCSNAQPISGVGNFAFDNTSATTDGPSACGGLGRDVWYSWVAPSTDDYQVSTCGLAGWDTALAVYSGDCGNLNLEDCNDDACSLRSTVSWSAMAGSTYLIRAGSFNGSSSGVGEIEISLGGGGSGGCANPTNGPDVIVGVIPNISNWGGLNGMGAYSLGTTSCNVGDDELLWIASSTEHPVIGQNIYRMENGRFQQLGQSWLKHGFVALQGTACCSCSPAANGSRLGVGCSDPYGSSLNGSQGGLGPRFEVNPFTGQFAWPFFRRNQGGDRVDKRIQVPQDEVDPATHPTAVFMGEAQYITPDDAAAGNGFNNVSWVRLNRSSSQSNGAWSFSIGGATQREASAVEGWASLDPNVVLSEINVPGEGQFIAGSNAVENGDGTWTYNYAIFNNNSDLSGQSFTVPLGANVSLFDVGMSFPHYHSGEPYTNQMWVHQVGGGAITWATQPHSANVDANALRWGTTYSFWFTADTGPEPKAASLGLFKPGGPGDQTFAVEGPMDGTGGGSVIINNYCSTNPNTTGQTSKILASNADLMARTMQLDAFDMTPNAFGFFLTSMTEAFVPNPGGSAGNLCLGGNIGRGVGGGIWNSGATGTWTTTVDLDNIPTPTGTTVVMSGDTWHFQAWHRDISSIGTPTSNFTDGVRVRFP